MDRKTVDQPKTEVWRDDASGLLCIKQDVEPGYSDVPSIVTIDPVFLPTLIEWLQELLPKAE